MLTALAVIMTGLNLASKHYFSALVSFICVLILWRLQT